MADDAESIEDPTTGNGSDPADGEFVRRPGSRPLASLLTGPIGMVVGIAAIVVGIPVLIVACWWGAVLFGTVGRM